MDTLKHVLHIGQARKMLGSTVLWLLALPGESIPNCPCIALGQESYPFSNLIYQRFSLVKHGVGQNIPLYASSADRTSTVLYVMSAFPVHSTSFSGKE